ncbi:MAG: beta-lactamase family protein [Bacteroidaceae bacterium]|nr:beta-lactamase family protein [Bacteroidaceae bacterium]
MKRILLFFTLFLFVVLSANSQNSVADSTSTDTDLHSRITSLMKDAESIGLSVAVVKNNQVVYYNSFGYNPDYNDPEKRKPIEKTDIFRIASVSKTFVATAILQLREKGKIDLDADINKYLKFRVRNPKFPDTPITVRMLIRHRSSITDAKYSTYSNKLDVFFSPDSEDYKAVFLDDRPGTKYEYSNYGYNLLGAIVENVSGKKFDEYIDENIMKPLGINGSYNVSKLDSTKFVRAMSYNERRKTFIKNPTMYNPYTEEMKNYQLGKSTGLFSPAGGVKMSVLDLTKYMMMHMNYGTYNGVQILTKESELLMQTQPNKNTKFGVGFYHSAFGMQGVDFVGHNGTAYGVHSEMFFNPEKKFGFVVICNGCNSGHKLNEEVIRVLYNAFIK